MLHVYGNNSKGSSESITVNKIMAHFEKIHSTIAKIQLHVLTMYADNKLYIILCFRALFCVRNIQSNT